MEMPTDNHKDQSRYRNLAVSLFITGLFILAAAVLVLGIKIFFLAFAGILFAILLRAMSRWIASKLPVSERWTVVVATLVLVIVLGGAGWALVPSLSEQADLLTKTLPRSVKKIESSLARHELGRLLLSKAPEAKQAVTNNGDMVKTISNAFRMTITVVGSIVAIFFMGLFFAFSPGSYTRGVIALTPRNKEKRVKEVLNELHTTLLRWLQGQLIDMAIVAVLITVGLWALGVEMALVLGLIAGLLEFIPNIGPIAAAIPAILVGLLDDPTQAFYIMLLYFGVQTVQSNLITPLVQKRMVRLPPALILSVQFLMGFIIGTVALALATPLAAAAIVMVKMLYVHDVLGKEIKLPGEHTE